MADFEPGDVIISPRKQGSKGHRYVVLSPTRTRGGKGKLRVQPEGAQHVLTTWWSPEALPPGYRWERP